MKNMDKSNMPELDLELQIATELADLPSEAQWQTWFQKALFHNLQLTVRIVDAEEGQQLNRDYRHKDYATNVLTFVYDSVDDLADANDWVCGDVVICAPVIVREAAEQNKLLESHYAHMAIHAALHLQGYDHEQEDEAEQMEAIETRLMLELNYPDPYASEHHG